MIFLARWCAEVCVQTCGRNTSVLKISEEVAKVSEGLFEQCEECKTRKDYRSGERTTKGDKR